MGYPGDEGGSPPDTRAGSSATPHRGLGLGHRPGAAQTGLSAPWRRRRARSGSWIPGASGRCLGACCSVQPPAGRPTAPWIPGPSTRQPQLSERQSRAAAAAAPAGCYGPGGIPGAEPRDAPACGRTPGRPAAPSRCAGGTTGGGVRPGPRHRRRPAARRPRPGRTPGAARQRSARATRSRAAPARPAGPVPARRPADRCGARARSARPARAGAARSAASRPPRERLTRCTRQASSRRGTRRSCAPRPGIPATPWGWAPIWPNPAIRSWRSATRRPMPRPPRPGPCWTRPSWPASGPARRPKHPARRTPAHATRSRRRMRGPPAHRGLPASPGPRNRPG